MSQKKTFKELRHKNLNQKIKLERIERNSKYSKQQTAKRIEEFTFIPHVNYSDYRVQIFLLLMLSASTVNASRNVASKFNEPSSTNSNALSHCAVKNFNTTAIDQVTVAEGDGSFKGSTFSTPSTWNTAFFPTQLSVETVNNKEPLNTQTKKQVPKQFKQNQLTTIKTKPSEAEKLDVCPTETSFNYQVVCHNDPACHYQEQGFERLFLPFFHRFRDYEAPNSKLLKSSFTKMRKQRIESLLTYLELEYAKAKLEGKTIGIVMGEVHDSYESLVEQKVILEFAKKIGIHQVKLEWSKVSPNRIVDDYYKIIAWFPDVLESKNDYRVACRLFERMMFLIDKGFTVTKVERNYLQNELYPPFFDEVKTGKIQSITENRTCPDFFNSRESDMAKHIAAEPNSVSIIGCMHLQGVKSILEPKLPDNIKMIYIFGGLPVAKARLLSEAKSVSIFIKEKIRKYIDEDKLEDCFVKLQEEIFNRGTVEDSDIYHNQI